MGYRLPPAPDRRVHYDATASESVITIDAGTVTRLAIPCFYRFGQILTRQYVMRVDHAGWPSPGHPDDSWQWWDHPDDAVHLEDEGYTDVVTHLDPSIEGVSISGTIDINVVRLTIDAREAVSHTSSAFDLHITGEDPDTGDPLDSVITKGTFRVMTLDDIDTSE